MLNTGHNAVILDGGFGGTQELQTQSQFVVGSEGQVRPREVSLALQGGGSFGAFTWGFLDRLLEEDNLVIDMVSGASAGALNAVLMADGLAADGPAEARVRLESFWHQVGHATPHLPTGRGQLIGTAAFELTTHLASPYQFNPLGLNPLRGMLSQHVDFERLRAQTPVRLLIATTRVKDGRLRLFREDEVTSDAVLASTCLPFLHHAVEIDGEAYWDGGYSANPPLRQLIIDTQAKDVILVQLLSEEHEGVPHFSRDISRRLQEMSFSSSLQKELETIEDVRQLCRSPGNQSSMCQKLQDLQIHRVKAADFVENLDDESALDTRWSLLSRLKEDGRRAAETWLLAHPVPDQRAETVTHS